MSSSPINVTCAHIQVAYLLMRVWPSLETLLSLWLGDPDIVDVSAQQLLSLFQSLFSSGNMC